MKRIPTKGDNEYDVLCKGLRRIYCRGRKESTYVKKKYRRRFRQHEKKLIEWEGVHA